MEDAIEEYRSSLEDLTFNSKPHINMLTILADENKQHAEFIVRLIEAHLAKASAKLPIMYLVDSIVKNVGEKYKLLFAKDLINSFKIAFESADDKSKMSLYKLRTTWHEYFPLKKLHALDLKIKTLDPNWPVKPLPPFLQESATNIHVNPKFLKKNETNNNAGDSVQATAAKTKLPKQITLKQSGATKQPAQSSEVDKIRQQLVQQQKELLDLQQKKLILELEQTKQKLEAKQREAKTTTIKKQDKLVQDPRLQATISHAPAAGLKVTLTNDKMTPAPANQTATAPKDPRLKSTPSKKTPPKNTNNAAKKVVESSTKTLKNNLTKKKPPKNTSKIVKQPSPNRRPAVPLKSPTMKPQSKAKIISANKDTRKKRDQQLLQENSRNSEDTDRLGKRPFQKPHQSPSPPPSKILHMDDFSTKSVQHVSTELQNNRQIPERESRTIQALRNESRNSPISSTDGSFSPEPDEDTSHQVADWRPSSKRMKSFEQRDALKRRPSFDPDIFIPQELTLEHQNEILKQADNQLQTGHLTHEQHQEMLKQLHQLFEMQRKKKMHCSGLLPPPNQRIRRGRSPSPTDPRRRSKHNNVPSKIKRMKMEPPRYGKDSEFNDPRDRPPLIPSCDMPGYHPPRPRFPPNKGPPFNERRRDPRFRRVPPVEEHSSNSHTLKKRFHPGVDQTFSRPPSLHRSSPPRDTRQVPNRSQFLKKSSTDRIKRPSAVVERLSPPPFLRDMEGSKKTIYEFNQPSGEKEAMSEHSKQQSLRKYAHIDPQGEKSDHKKRKDVLSSHSNVESPKQLKLEQPDIMMELKESEDCVIASSPSGRNTESDHKLEESKNYIVTDMDEAKVSCEEPEDFIIANIPPGAEAYHKHSMSLKRNSVSEKAYMDHMKKIKQSIYTKELNDARKASESGAVDESASEKSNTENESTLKKSETIKSPPLPLKKRRYISSEIDPNDKKEMPETSSSSVDDSILPKSDTSKSKQTKPKTKKSASNTDNSVVMPEKVPSVKKDNTADQAKEPKLAMEETKKPAAETKEKNPTKGKCKETTTEKTKDFINKGLKEKVLHAESKHKDMKELNLPKQVKQDKLKKEVSYRSDYDGDNSLVYVLESEEESKNDSPPKREPRRRESRPPRSTRMPRRWSEERRKQEEEEFRIQRLLEDEQKQIEWEDSLHRELEREHWKEERIRRAPIGWRGRGRGVHYRPDRWMSPPRERELLPLDIAHGNLRGNREQINRPRPLPLDRRRERDHHFSPVIGPSLRPPPPGWELRRGRLTPPPDLRLPPPPPHRIGDKMPPDWDLPPSRLPPREHGFHPERPPFVPEGHRSPVEHIAEPVNPPSALNQVNVNKLLSDLLNMGIIPGNIKQESKSSSPVPLQTTEAVQVTTAALSPAEIVPELSVPTEKTEEATHTVSSFNEEELMALDPDAELPDITLNSDLKIRQVEIITRLHTGMQCSACGLRFTTRQTDLYAEHLDWHYRNNRKDKEGNALTHREIYPSAGEWICYEEIENPQERSKNPFFEESETAEAFSQRSDENDTTVPLTGKPGEDTCKVCKEAFETIYSEVDDEWQFANCVQVDGDNFHPNCYGDHYDPLPTPSSTPTLTQFSEEVPDVDAADTVQEPNVSSAETSVEVVAIKDTAKAIDESLIVDCKESETVTEETVKEDIEEDATIASDDPHEKMEVKEEEGNTTDNNNEHQIVEEMDCEALQASNSHFALAPVSPTAPEVETSTAGNSEVDHSPSTTHVPVINDNTEEGAEEDLPCSFAQSKVRLDDSSNTNEETSTEGIDTVALLNKFCNDDNAVESIDKHLGVG